jgi:predicted DNA-binding transcriptional regulator YafY
MTSHDTPRVHARALSRILAIHQEVSTGRYPTVRRLADVLERSERTVKRDLRFMRDQLGAPLEFDREKRGWRYRELGWRPPPVRFGEGELLAFFTAEQVLRAAGRTPEAELLRAALAKLASHLPESVTVNLHTLGEAISFEPLPYAAVAPDTLLTLARTAAERRTVEFDYHSQHRDARTRRRADVLLLHNFGGDWYAVAFDHLRKEVRDFHAGRMTRLTETAASFEPPLKWDGEKYLRRGFHMTRGGRATTVEVIFDQYQARWMRERLPFHPDEKREELPGGELRLSFPTGTGGLEAVARFCLAYAGHCRVERPPALRRLVREKLLAAIGQHQAGQGGSGLPDIGRPINHKPTKKAVGNQARRVNR